jgi:integrase
VAKLSKKLSPKSKVHIRGTLSILWDFAMWRGDVVTQRNPMELVTVKGATKRTQKPRSLTVAEFQKFIVHLGEPFRTMALLCVCFGLRISEALALRWSDFDWRRNSLRFWHQYVHLMPTQRARNLEIANRSGGFPRSFHVEGSARGSRSAYSQVRHKR